MIALFEKLRKKKLISFFLFIMKGSMLRYMICHVTLSKMPLREKIFLTVMGTKMKILGEFKGRKLQYSNVINSKSVELYYRVDYIDYSLIEEFNYIKNDGQKICLQAMYTDDAGKHGEVIKLH
ncbi:hypothetical protein SEEA1981_21011 [Salmonella enterica subsp. enterica serovar Agona str. 241981]|nr:hypothetical protein SEEA1981_21011 [Salmonella enterica subsp. enterica serovar Agona str. 241981]